MKVDILAVGKLKEAFWRDACAEYLKRLSAYAKVNVQEIPDSCPCNEAPALFAHLDALSPSTQVVLLDIQGKETSSEQLAEKLENWTVGGVSHLVFVIGGSEGVTYEIKQRANERLSFGPITLPHNLARVVLLEQLYRAFKIQRKEPYHK
ncbi:MAG: 23S rRNA (pseudouridine(1915)-N(3))-methyltransferase RlmH [Schwartzia sp.]|nr:23S rRNA (pseudouridine(1915)-N(3))-methyltransferase RlmH [Eggerthellaceae bacterium]MBR1885461.1 23S rRNA (pseudouridine(1915)-N(3))-methyltransferase RlmH [Schwartzia sp. (in: firmicutes)]